MNMTGITTQAALKNLEWVASRTDEEMATWPDPMDELFGVSQRHPEDRREEARRLADKIRATEVGR